MRSEEFWYALLHNAFLEKGLGLQPHKTSERFVREYVRCVQNIGMERRRRLGEKQFDGSDRRVCVRFVRRLWVEKGSVCPNT